MRVSWLGLVLPVVCLPACSSGDEGSPANAQEAGSGASPAASGGGPAGGAGTGGGTAKGGAGPENGGAGSGNGGNAGKASAGMDTGGSSAGSPPTPQGGASGASGGADTGGAGTGGASTQWEWPTFEEAEAAPMSTPVLVVLLDFSDSDMSDVFAEPEKGWSNLVFGREQAQGNHFWHEISIGQLQLLKAAETGGEPNDGVISIKVSDPRPTDGTYLVEQQTWIPEALDKAASFVDFAAFDEDGDGMLKNTELSVMFVLNMEYANVNGAGAQANIPINHPIAGAGVSLAMFTRVMYTYTSIGTPMHELGHHIPDLDHGPAPSEHDLMGLGAYAEDPVITTLHNPNSHYATRPTGLQGINKISAGFVEATRLTETTRGFELYSPETGKAYNVLELPVVDGFMYLENRNAWSYDQSIPFCDGDTGGVFAVDASQYLSPLNIPQITALPPLSSFDVPDEVFCDFYATNERNSTFSLGGWTIENVSAPGPVMTLDIVKEDVTPVIERYKYRYWRINPDMEGYRMWHWEEAPPNGNVTIDFSTFPDGENPDGYFTISLQSFYSTGEVRSANLGTTWTSDSPYVTVYEYTKIMNPGSFRDDAIIRIILNFTETYSDTATVSVANGTFQSSFTLTNIPPPP